MRQHTFAIALVLATAFGGIAIPAQASQNACLLEGSFTVMGRKTEIKDCLHNGGVPAAQFAEMCQGISASAAAMGGPPAKITWLAACPAGAQARCERMYGGPLTGHYYLRDAALLADSQTGCKAGGGTWKR